MEAAPRMGSQSGADADTTLDKAALYVRFQDIPSAIDIPLQGGGEEQEAVEVDLESLDDDPSELCTLLENERISKNIWMTIGLAYAKQGQTDLCISILNQAIDAFKSIQSEERLSLLTALCWLYLLKCRSAPRVRPEGSSGKTKEEYLALATSTLNDASKIKHTYPPLFLARGALCLLKASLISFSRSSNDSRVPSERNEVLKQGLKSFDDAHRASGGSNLVAYFGKARVFYAFKEYTKALDLYQTILARCPSLSDPDPRIGIGCCLWNLHNRDQAKLAWERALELNPSSPVANMLMGIYYIQLSSKYSPTDPQFAEIYKKGMTKYAQSAYKLPGGSETPLVCSTFANYFLRTKAMPQVEKLSRRAIENTDVNAIASDGWYLLAAKEHHLGNVEKAAEFYHKADVARGEDQGHVAARFGISQISVQTGDYPNAKFRLEKLIQVSKSIEAMTLLGTLLAEEVFSFSSQTGDEKEANRKKAIQLLESVRGSWGVTNKSNSADPSVLLTLARLYESFRPERSLQCLQQVEQIELEAAKAEEGIEASAEITNSIKAKLRNSLPPQLLSNIGCLLYQDNRLETAKEYFQAALTVCYELNTREVKADTDALMTTITFNLGRTQEALKIYDEAKASYEEVLKRHSGYLDAKIRLAFIALQQDPKDAGSKAVQELYQSQPSNLEVRALYGWYLHKAKKRTLNIAEDQEQRHYKHTLQQFNKHDHYALTGMGNVHLSIAREMPRVSEQDKEKRYKMYQRSIEFFDKAVQLDPSNAYATQGVAIALAEARKDFASSIQLFSKVRESIAEPSVLINLGHAFADLRQFSRSIESYMTALSKDRAEDTQLLSCLGRVWLMKGRQEKDLTSMKMSLNYSKEALAIQPDQVYFKFNVAFVQSQIAQQVYNMPETQRTSLDIKDAATGLDEAIETFLAVAQHPNPPYPQNDIEQRASMGKNTTKKQLERALQSQEEYERRNQDKIKRALELREAETRRKEQEERKKTEETAERRRQIELERERMRERDREFADRKAEAERQREEAEYTTDAETGERRKRAKRKSTGGSRRKAEADSDLSGAEERPAKKKRPAKRKSKNVASSGSEDGDAPSQARKQKKRRIDNRAKTNSKKFKSSEMVDDDDSDVDPVRSGSDGEKEAASGRKPVSRRVVDDEDESEAEPEQASSPLPGVSDGEGDEADGLAVDIDDAKEGDDVEMAD